MGNRHGADKNKKKDDKKKDKDTKKQKNKKKTKNRNSSTPSEQDSQAAFESLEDLSQRDLSQGACASPRKQADVKSQIQPDVLADITFDPATRPRDQSMHGAWSSDDESPDTTLGYSTPLLQTPKIQRSAHATPEVKRSVREHAHELETSIEYKISQNLASSQGEVRLRNKSESLSPASSPALSRDVRKKRALGQAIHENGSSKAIEAAILSAPPGSDKDKRDTLQAIRLKPEINVVCEDRDSLEDALCPWLKDDEVSIDEEQLDEMFISCIDLSYSMADACSEKEFTGGSEADFSSLESKSRIKDIKRKQKQAAASSNTEWEGSSVDPIARGVRNPPTNQNKPSPMLKSLKAEQTKSERNTHKMKPLGSSVDHEEQAPILQAVDADSPTHPFAIKQINKDNGKSKNKPSGKPTTPQEDSNLKENETGLESKANKTKKHGHKPVKKFVKSKDKKRKSCKTKIVPMSDPACVETDSDVTIQDEHKYQTVECTESVEVGCNTGLGNIPDDPQNMSALSRLEENKEQILDDVILRTIPCLDSTSGEPHRFIGDGQTPADFAASIMSSMSDTPRDLTIEAELRDSQPMSKLVQRITGFIREETIVAEESETNLQKQPVLSRDTTRGVRTDVSSDTYSQVLDKVFMKSDKTNVGASFSDGYAYQVSGSDVLCDQNKSVDREKSGEIPGEHTPNTRQTSDLCKTPPHLYPEEYAMHLTQSENAVFKETAKLSGCLLKRDQHRSITCSEADNIAGQITGKTNEPTVRESMERADDKHSYGQLSYTKQIMTNPCLERNHDSSPTTLSELEAQLSEASKSASFTSTPLATTVHSNQTVSVYPVERTDVHSYRNPVERADVHDNRNPVEEADVRVNTNHVERAEVRVNRNPVERADVHVNTNPVEQDHANRNPKQQSNVHDITNPVEQFNGTSPSNTADKHNKTPPGASLASSHVPPPSPTAMNALAELDEDAEDVAESASNQQNSREIQLFGDSVLKRLSSLIESQGNDSTDDEISSKSEHYDKQGSTTPEKEETCGVFSVVSKDECLPASVLSHSEYDKHEVSGSLLESQFEEYVKVPKQISQPECKQNIEVSKDKSFTESDVKTTESQSPECKKKVENSQRMFRNGQSVSSITSTDIDNQTKDVTEIHSSQEQYPVESEAADIVKQTSQSGEANDNKGGNTKRKSKSKKAKAKAKKLQAKAKKSKSAQADSKENVNPKITVRPKIPDELTYVPGCENPKTDSNSESNPDSNPVLPKRESQQITEVIDAYGDVINPTTGPSDQINPSEEQTCQHSDNADTLTKKKRKKDDKQKGTRTENKGQCLESDNAAKLAHDYNKNDAVVVDDSLVCDTRGTILAGAADCVVEYYKETEDRAECRLLEAASTNQPKRPGGLPLHRIIQDAEKTFRETKASWELSDDSDTTEESFENIDIPAGHSLQCESSSSADSVFRIPDISETFGEMDSVKDILDDFEDRTPQAEPLPRFDPKELLRSQPEFLNVHRRSRMSPALTNRTESDLDVSEMRDDISTDSMYADDEGDGTLLFSKSYTEQAQASGLLMSCTFYNSGHSKEDSDDFWEECAGADEAYHQIEICADAASATFEDARKQMQDIHQHLMTLRLQMETLQDDLENASITPDAEFQTESDDKRLITE